MRGAYAQARAILQPVKAQLQRAHYIDSIIARLEGEPALALEYYQQALDDIEPLAVIDVHGGAGLRRAFPDFYALPAYERMRERLGLDPAALARLEFPALSF